MTSADTDNARRRHLAEMTRQAFADGLYETSAADYAEALRRARAEPTTDIAEDAWEVIVRVRDDYPRVINDAPTEEIVEALADAGLLATTRTATTATVEDTARAIHRALAPRWMSVAQALGPDQDAYEAMLADIAQALADGGLLATARPTRDEVARAIRLSRTNGLCKPGVRCDLCDCAQEYEDDLALRDADAVLALFNEKGD